MKNRITFLLVMLAGICFSSAVSAQDMMYKKNKEVIKVKVTEVGLDEIKYKYWDNRKGPTFVIDKNDLIKIEFADGRVEYYTNSLENPAVYEGQRKHAIKTGFLAPAFNHINLSYQRSVKPGMNYEVTVGYIGAGNKEIGDNERGGYVKFGWAFMRTPTFSSKSSTRYAHLLKGAYIRPEITLGAHTTSYETYDPNQGVYKMEETRVNFAAFMLNTGYQNVYADRFIIDYSVGLGYAGTRFKNEPNGGMYGYYYRSPFHYAFLGGNDFPIAVTMGLKLGVLIK